MKRFSITLLLWGTLCCTGFSLEWTPELTSAQIRKKTEAYITNQNHDQGITELTEFLSKTLNASQKLEDPQLEILASAADCIQLMKLTRSDPLNAEVLQWILGSDLRTHRLVDTAMIDAALPQDRKSVNSGGSLREEFLVLEKLWSHDPEGRDEYFELMLAMSVVWDQPRRPIMHGQMGAKKLTYKPEILKRYDYYKTLYAERKAVVPYSWLSATELIFVVDTPVPLTELEWAMENEQGTRTSWKNKYSSIQYDHKRRNSGQYTWSSGMYTLEAIKETGGICVDQAYYAVMTARAFGIPAIYFSGAGTTGYHAWFSYMVESDEWVLDVGRYQGQEYSIGKARNPQTNQFMTDHDVDYAYSRSTTSDSSQKACLYISIAQALVNDNKNILRCTQRSRKLSKSNQLAWALEMDALLTEKDLPAIIKLYEAQKRIFRDYPDIMVATAKKILPALKEAEEQKEIEALMKSLERLTVDRDDLIMEIGTWDVSGSETTDLKAARSELEDLMEEQVNGGNKTTPLIRQYLELTKGTDQTKYAARFLEKYIQRIINSNARMSESNKQRFLSYLAQAYTNDGDSKEHDKVMRRIEKSKEKEKRAH